MNLLMLIKPTMAKHIPELVPTSKKPEPKVGFFDDINTPFQFFLHFPWVIPILIVGIYVGIHFGWKKLDVSYNMKGQPLAPWKDYIKRIRGIMYKEDLTAVFTKPQFLVQKFPGFIWQSFWKIVTIMVLAEFALLMVWPSVISLMLLIPTILICLFGVKHIKLVFSIRMRTIMQMFEVAEASMRYTKGANLNPWGYIIITSWGNPDAPNLTAIDNLYSPGPTYVMYNAKFQSEDQRNRDAFEKNFNGTVSDQHTWIYEWESANNRVLCTPVPFIPATIVPYPFPDRRPWNIFPLGEAAGGKEAFLDVKVFPHLLIAGVTGSGKDYTLCQVIPVPISESHPTGWTTFGDIKVGDTIFDEKGKPCKVFGISEINKTPDIYKVSFSDDTSVEAGAEHLWRTESRKSLESHWRSNNKFVERRSLIEPDGIKALQLLLSLQSKDDEITIDEVASVAKVNPTSPWLLDIAKAMGHVGEIQIVAEFHYKEQIVKQRQKVTRYPAKQVWETLGNHVFRSNARITGTKEQFLSLANNVDENMTVTAKEVAQVAGYPTLSHARNAMQRFGIEGIVGVEIVELHVPEKTLTRKNAWARTYPAREFINTILERVETPAHDQRHKKTFSAIRTTLEITETLRTPDGNYLNHSIPVAPPLELPEAKLPIGPYLYGSWLGDGSSREGQICGMDHEIARNIEAEGYILKEKIPKVSPLRKPYHKDFRLWKVEGLTGLLRENGWLQLNTAEGTRKHIPAIYLRASIAQRRALLAGLLDTDGTVGGSGGVEFTNTNRDIAYGALELARTLGYRATITESRATLYGKDCGPKWTVAFTCDESPFRLTRKTKTFNERGIDKNAEKTDRRYITNVEKIESSPSRCIQVDSPSRMFLAGESFVATHNSVTQRTLLMHCLQSPDWRIALVDPKRVELSAYKTHPNVVAVATELDESLALIGKVEQEMQSRYILMQKEGVNFFQNLTTPPPALLLMVDETYALLAPEKIKNDEGKERDEMHARITLLIGAIARLGRAAGVHMILATQRPDAAVLPGETKANLDARIAQGRMDSTPSNMTLDSDAATRIPNVKGRAVLRTGNDFTEFQAYFLPEQQLELVLEMAGALATGQVDISAFNDDEPAVESSGKRSFRLPKFSLRLPRLPSNLGGSLRNWFESRKALAEGNDARSTEAREAAIASEGREKSRRESKGEGRSKDRQKSLRGRRERSPRVHGEEDDIDEELDIDAIAEAAKARGPLTGMNLDPNNFYDSVSSAPLAPTGTSYADADEYDDSEFETDETSLSGDVDEIDEPVAKFKVPVMTTPPVPSISAQEEEIPDRDALIRLAQEREDNIHDEVTDELTYPDFTETIVPAIVPQETRPTVSISINDISVDEVLRRAAQRGVAIPASELLAALRYEARIAESGGVATPIPVPTSAKMPTVESVPVLPPIILVETVVESVPIPVALLPKTGMPKPPGRVEPQPIIAEVTSNEAPWMPKEIQPSDINDTPFRKS